MKNLSLQQMSRQAIIAAIYVALTLSIAPFAYGAIQFRYSEILNLLAFFNPINAIGVTIGVFISNLWSTLGIFDLVFGTLHTAISLYFISKSKNLIIASIWPTVFSFIIGYELSFLAGFGSFWLMTAQVMASEFVIMTILSVPVFKLLKNNKSFLNAIGAYREDRPLFNNENNISEIK